MRTKRHRVSIDAPSHALEGLEGRRLFALDHALFYPEGYTHSSINEFVPITNTNGFEVEYELHARYEVGERDQLLASGVIPANTRGGVTIHRSDDPANMLVRPDTPYALVLRSSAPLAAAISHYDFGTAIGESFTATTSTDWTFAEGYKDSNWTRDFVVLYNPSATPVDVTLTAYTGNGQMVTLTKRVGAQRRSGWSLDAEAALPAGVFGVKVHATAPIVAALSHYEIVTQRGFGAIGQKDGGATAGIVTAIEFDDGYSGAADDNHRGRRNRGGGGGGGGGGSGGGDSDDDDSSGSGSGGGGSQDDDDDSSDDNYDNDSTDYVDDSTYAANSYILVLNTNDTAATVTFTFLARDDSPTLSANYTRTIVVPPQSRSGLTYRDLGFFFDDEVGVAYRSDLPVTVTAAVYQGRDATGVEAATTAATEWGFGEGYMSRTRAGRAVTNDIYIFNPTSSTITVSIYFKFSTGQTVTVTKTLSPLEIEDVKAHAMTSITGLAEDVFYGVQVSSPVPVVASMEHWDRDLGGGFATLGVPGGTLAALSDIMII